VLVSAFVDGASVLSNLPFQWDNNSGALYMELENLAAGTKIDNMTISSVPSQPPSALLSISGFGFAALRRRRA
jgi:MYXO-CTERM domain-containing protein